MPRNYIFTISLFLFLGCDVQESNNIYTPPNTAEHFNNKFEPKIFNTEETNIIKIKLQEFAGKKNIDLNKSIQIDFNITDISDYIDCGYMNNEIYVDYIERIFGSKLKADIKIDIEEIEKGLLFKNFDIKYVFTSKETGTRWRFATNKPKDLLVGNPVYESNPYRKCLSKNRLENEITKYFNN